MDEFTKLISKIDFNKFFDLQLQKYAQIIDKNSKDGQWNFQELTAAKEIFRDNLFQWLIKMINQPIRVITPETLEEVEAIRIFIKHSRDSSTEHTSVGNDRLERILNVISNPNNKQDNPSVKV